MERIGLSLIACTRNRAALLGKLLASIEREVTDRLNLEVIVVDNASSDDTAAVVAAFAGRIPGLRRVFEPTPGLSFARNRGAAAATKEYLLYIDDDAILTEAFLDRAEVVLRRFRPDLFGGPILPYFDRPLPDWFDPTIEVRQFERFSGFSEKGSVSGGNFGIRRAVLDRLGPFDTALGMQGDVMAFGEDREMVERYRARTPPSQHRLYYAVELAVHHYTLPAKLDRRYQLERKYENARAQEHTFIATGKRSLARSIVYAGGHLVLFPYYAASILRTNGFGANGRFKVLRHAYGIAGRAHGVLDVTLAATRPRLRSAARGPLSGGPTDTSL
ncbi:MAG TPA: glycosyltransferase family A protein [Hyphomicrobiaceae bacterium]|nr:glycosyltransferase family A protein [Hyphomicrobiaceae bacterium]